jgi:hypothetical protein
MTRDDSEIARLLAAARQADLPDAQRLARVRARLPQPSAAGGQSSHSSSSASAAVRGAALKIGATMLVLAGGVFAYRQVSVPRPVEPSSVERHAPVLSQPSLLVEPDASVSIAAPEPTPRELTPAPTAVPRAKRKPKPRMSIETPVAEPAKPASPVSTLSEESSLLRLVTLAARACRLDEAQAGLAQFAQRYPHSQLNAERERLSVSIQELARTGRCKP